MPFSGSSAGRSSASGRPRAPGSTVSGRGGVGGIGSTPFGRLSGRGGLLMPVHQGHRSRTAKRRTAEDSTGVFTRCNISLWHNPDHSPADSPRSERPVRVGPFLTLLCHRRPKFPVMHNVPCSKDVLGSERWLEGNSETARIYQPFGWRGSVGVSGMRARIAARDWCSV